MLNNITVQGRLVAEPEFRQTQSGVSVTTFTLACNRDYDREQADFISCICWRGTAEFVSKHFHKGQLAIAAGRLQSRKWEDKDGNKRTSWDVVAENVYFCERKAATPDVQYTEVDDDEEMPF